MEAKIIMRTHTTKVSGVDRIGSALAAMLVLLHGFSGAVIAQTPQATAPAIAATVPPMADCVQVTDTAKAVAACSAILKSRGADNATLLAAYRARAVAQLAAKKTSEALSDMTRALVLDPNNPTLWVERGDLRASLGQRIRAAADFSVALKYDPKNVKALIGRGEQFRGLGALQRAIADHTDALRIDAKAPAAYAGRAYAQQRLGKDKEAAADAEEAIKLDPKSALAYLARGLAQVKADKVKAVADLKKALELDPGSAVAKSELEKLSR